MKVTLSGLHSRRGLDFAAEGNLGLRNKGNHAWSLVIELVDYIIKGRSSISFGASQASQCADGDGDGEDSYSSR